jgi:hypothetical protein
MRQQANEARSDDQKAPIGGLASLIADLINSIDPKQTFGHRRHWMPNGKNAVAEAPQV